jgi:hypothetical protein
MARPGFPLKNKGGCLAMIEEKYKEESERLSKEFVKFLLIK